MVDLRWVPHSHGPIQRVPVPAALPLSRDITSLNEIRDDPLGSSLRDPDRMSDITEPHGRTALQAQEHLGVAREKVPTLGFRT